MADKVPPPITPTPEQRRIASDQFARAKQILATNSNHDYGIQLLTTCCKLDPTCLPYRQALRKVQKAKYKNNLRGSSLALVSTAPARAKMKSAKINEDWAKVLEHGEEVLCKNPWDTSTQLDMAEACDKLGLIDMGIWLLDQAREKDGDDIHVNRALAKLFERKGDFQRAAFLWNLVLEADPLDLEAARKKNALAASEAIIRGQYSEKPTDIDDEPEPEVKPSQKPEKKAESPRPDWRPEPVLDRVEREAAPHRKRIADNPTDAYAYLQLASVLRKGGRADEAKEILEQGHAATGQDFQITIELAEMELEPFRRNLGIVDAKLADPDEPTTDELRKLRVRLLKEINTRELDLFRMKADRFPQELSYALELGLRLLRAGQTDAAIPPLQQARKDGRLQWKALMYLGYCFKARNNWRLAQRNFEESLASMPADEEASRKDVMYQLAQGAADSGDLSRAVDLALELVNLDFGYRDIGKLLDEWQERMQQS